MPGKVLLADDSLNIQKTVSQLLRDAGIEVVTVGNGEHAVRRLADIKPDLVLADVFMPVRSGFEVCEYIKNEQQFAHVPVLLLTSSMEPYDEKEARRVGADGRLVKPFTDPIAALATIKQWLGKATQVQAKAAPAAAPIEEFAVAVPAEAEAEPAPEYSTQPAAVSFEQQEAPMGFSDLLESAPAAAVETPPAPTPAAEPAPEVLTPAPESPPVALEAPAAIVPEAEPEAAAPTPEPAPALTASLAWPAAEAPATELPPPPIALQPEPAPAPIEEAPRKSEYKIEKPELASAWEMTAPPPGAPEIPSGGGWDSQWKGVEGEAATGVEAPPAEEPAPAGDRFDATEFAAAMAAAEVAPPPAEEPAAVSAGELAAAGVDPALVEAVVQEVMRRLTPQVVQQITREIIRPLVEALLKLGQR